MTAEPAVRNAYLWPVRLAAGVSRGNFAVGLAAVGYGSVCLVTDPINNPWFWLWLVVLGMGVISPVLAAQALLGQETQPELRGAVNGLFSAMGAVGILAISLAGGYLFDLWKPYPFLVVAVMNLLLLGAGFRLGEQPGRK